MLPRQAPLTAPPIVSFSDYPTDNQSPLINEAESLQNNGMIKRQSLKNNSNNNNSPNKLNENSTHPRLSLKSSSSSMASSPTHVKLPNHRLISNYHSLHNKHTMKALHSIYDEFFFYDSNSKLRSVSRHENSLEGPEDNLMNSSQTPPPQQQQQQHQRQKSSESLNQHHYHQQQQQQHHHKHLKYFPRSMARSVDSLFVDSWNKKVDIVQNVSFSEDGYP
ncbi:unnamed protein product [Trichobilharzia regenti]|nr:unnamed protein product [Trichobilharzia regenti]